MVAGANAAGVPMPVMIAATNAAVAGAAAAKMIGSNNPVNRSNRLTAVVIVHVTQTNHSRMHRPNRNGAIIVATNGVTRNAAIAAGATAISAMTA